MWRRDKTVQPRPVVEAAEQTVQHVAESLDSLEATYRRAQELMDEMDAKFGPPPRRT